MNLEVKKPERFYYLDGAATTPLHKEVILAMQPYWQEKFGNPSSLYLPGRIAKMAVEESRAMVAQILKARPQEIIFTAGGTESANLAVFGVAREWQRNNSGKRGHLVISAIEHDAVLKSAQALQAEGWQISILPVSRQGVVELANLEKLVKPNTALVSVMYANNEVGSIQPISKLARKLAEINQSRQQKKLPKILLHTDACQVAKFLPIDVNKLGVDLMTINGSKLNGPKQVGILFKRQGIKIQPLIFGGGQEFGLRSGTENVAGIAGFTKALELSTQPKTQVKRIKKLLAIQARFNDRLTKKVSKSKEFSIRLNGPDLTENLKSYQHKGQLIRLPNNLSYTFKDIEGESLMIYLDAKGVSVATGSACSTSSNDPSHVLMAIGLSGKQAKETLRISLYEELTAKDIDYIVDHIYQSLTLIHH